MLYNPQTLFPFLSYLQYHLLFFSTLISLLLYVNTKKQNSVNEIDFTFSAKCKRRNKLVKNIFILSFSVIAIVGVAYSRHRKQKYLDTDVII